MAAGRGPHLVTLAKLSALFIPPLVPDKKTQIANSHGLGAPRKLISQAGWAWGSCKLLWGRRIHNNMIGGEKLAKVARPVSMAG